MSDSNTDLAIVGIGVLAGPQTGRSRRSIAAEAARLAIEDAGLRREDIDGAVELVGGGGAGSPPAYTDPFPRVLGLPVNFFFTIGRGGALGGLGIAAARSFLERGVSNYVCLSYGNDGWSRSRELRAKGGRGRTRIPKEGYWGAAVGDLQAASHHSWMAARHMAKYGTTSRQLGAIAVAQRGWACLNPEAKMYGRPITIDDHQNSPYIVEPYHLLDICQSSDGGIALVVTTAERARDLSQPAVIIRGQGFGEVLSTLWWQKENFEAMAVQPARDQAFGQAGIQLQDVDVAEFYDCFTAEVLFQIEGYGYCGRGEGGAYVEDGRTGPGGGATPVNTGGGLLSCYHMGDLTGLIEAVRQLRGHAGERQVPDCEVAISTGHGGEMVSPGMCSIHTCTVLAKG